MITAKLLARYDDAAGSAEAPVPVSALLAHLLYLRANGGLDSAIALADTFGTAAFVEVTRRSEDVSQILQLGFSVWGVVFRVGVKGLGCNGGFWVQYKKSLVGGQSKVIEEYLLWRRPTPGRKAEICVGLL